MKESSLKVVIAITEAYPILQVVFAQVSAEYRAERLRALAMIGLHLEGGSAFIRGAPGPARAESTGMAPVASHESLAFAVVLNEAQPRLYESIKATPARFRAERLRSLASLGAQVESGRLVMGAAVSRELGNSAAPAISPTLSAKPIRDDFQAPIPARPTSGPTESPETSAALPPAPATSEPQKVEQATQVVNKVGKGVRSFARSLG